MRSEPRPALVVEVIEDHLRNFGDSSAELISFLVGLGYPANAAVSADGNLYLPAPAKFMTARLHSR